MVFKPKNMEQKLINFFKDKYDRLYIKIESECNLKKIHDLFIHDIIFDDKEIKNEYGIMYFYRGVYALLIEKNNEHIIKYSKLSIEDGCKFGFGNLYKIYKEKNISDNLIEYYLNLLNNEKIEKHRIYYQIASIYSEQSNFNKSIEYYLLSLKEKSTWLTNNDLAVDYDKIKNFEKAEFYFLKAIDIEGNNYNPHYNLGKLYVDLKKYDLAEKYLLICVSNGKTKAYAELALTYRKTLNNTKAIEYYLLDFNINNNKNALLSIGIMLYEEKNYSEAIKYLLLARKEGKICFSVLFDSYLKSGRLDELDGLLMKEENLSVYDYLMLGMMRNFFKDHDQAENYFLIANSIDNENYLILKTLSIFYFNNLKIQECIKYTISYLKIGPIDTTDGILIIKNLNEILKMDTAILFENIDFFHRYLDKYNLDTVNKWISYIQINKHKMSNYMMKICCVNCKKENKKCVFAHCGHSICHKCYIKSSECHLCINNNF